MPSLLEKARKIPAQPKSKRLDLRERCELALAELAGDITASQMAAVLGIKASYVNSAVASALTVGIRAGIVKAQLVAPK